MLMDSCACCSGIWKPGWGRDRILPGDTGRSWFFINPVHFSALRFSLAFIGSIFLIFSMATDKPPPPPQEPAHFAQGWFAYWKFYSHWTLALCTLYSVLASMFSYALWKHEKNPMRREEEEERRRSSEEGLGRDHFNWGMEIQVAHRHVEVGSEGALEEGTLGGMIGRSSSIPSSSLTIEDEERGGLELEEEEEEEYSGRMREDGRSSSFGRGRIESNQYQNQNHHHHHHNHHHRRISFGELCIWFLYQTVWAASIFCACTFWLFIGIGCLPRKGCTDVNSKFWMAQVLNLLFLATEMVLNKLPFIPFHSILTLAYCVLWLIFSAILYFVTGQWVYPRSATHGQLYSAITFWPGWIALNVLCFFIGFGIEWFLSKFIPSKHSINQSSIINSNNNNNNNGSSSRQRF